MNDDTKRFNDENGNDENGNKEKVHQDIKNRKNKKRNIIIAVIVVFAVLFAGGAYYYYDQMHKEMIAEEKEDDTSAIPLVGVKSVHRDTLEKTASLTGFVEPDDTVLVISQISGEIEEIYVDEGDRVEEGDLLMAIEDGDYKLQLEEARSARNAAQAQLDEARAGPRDAEVDEVKTSLNMAKDQEEQMEKEFERLKNLHDEGYVSDQELEQAELQYKNAKEQVKAGEAALDAVEEGARDEQIRALESQVNQADVGVRLARRQLDRAQVESPGSGTVSSIDVSEGDMADTASPSMILIDTELVTVSAGLPEVYINSVREYQEVKVEVSSVRDEPFVASINRIGDMPPEDGRGYPLEVILPNEEGKLRAGMFSRLEVVVDSREDVPVIPRRAILEEGDETGVYIVEELGGKKTVDFRYIETGISEDGMVEVVEGLSEDKKVVVAGQGEVGPGDEVRLDNS